MIALQPEGFRVERNLRIEAPVSAVFAAVSDFNTFNRWSPWAKLGPNFKITVEGAPGSVGHKYAWEGNDDAVKGSMTCTDVKRDSHFTYRLNIKALVAKGVMKTIKVAPDGEGTLVTWSMSGTNDFMGKAFGLFFNMDEMIGNDFDKGLMKLRALLQAQAG